VSLVSTGSQTLIDKMGKGMPKGDLERGRRLFKMQCALCHTIAAGAEHKTGPNLYGVVGQASGTAHGYEYTDENQNKGMLSQLLRFR